MASAALRHVALEARRHALPEDLRDATNAQRVACACWLLSLRDCPACGTPVDQDADAPCCTAQARWAAFRARQLQSA